MREWSGTVRTEKDCVQHNGTEIKELSLNVGEMISRLNEMAGFRSVVQ
jgi:hypothetical protein